MSRRTPLSLAVAGLLAVGGAVGVGLLTATSVGAVGTCTITWTGGTTGTWGTAANWSPAAVPGSAGRTTDEACIPSTTTVTLDSASYTIAAINNYGGTPGRLSVTGGSLTISGAGGAVSALTGVSITGGTLTGNSALTVGSGGLLVGASASYGTLNGSGPFTVNGNFTVDGGYVYGNGPASTTFTVQNGRTIDLSAQGAQPGWFQNATLSAGNNDIAIADTFSLSSAVVTTTGELALAAGAAPTGGTVIAAGVTSTGAGGSTTSALTLTGTTSALGGPLSLGQLTVDSAASLPVAASRTLTLTTTTTINGSISGAGTVRVTGGGINVGAAGTLSPAVLNTTGGSVTINTSSTSSVGTLSITGGSVTVNNTMDVGSGGLIVGSTASTQGSLYGSGTVNVAGAVSINGGSISMSNGTIKQTGTHTFAIGSATYGLTTYQVYAYSTLMETPNDVDLSGVSNWSGSAVTTTGELNVAAGTSTTGSSTITAAGVTTAGASTLTITVVLTGSTSLLAGDLTLGGLGVSSSGSLSIGSGRTVTNTSGSLNIAGSISGAGTFRVTGGTPVVKTTGTFTPTLLRITGGGLTVENDATAEPGGVNVTGGYFTPNGTVNIGSGGLLVGSTASTIGYLSGTNGQVTVAGPISFTGGQASTSNVSVNQSSGFTFTVGSAIFGATQRDPYIYGTSFGTPNDVQLSDTITFSGSAIATTKRLVLGDGVQIAGSSNLSGRGITTTGATATVAPSITINGSTSDLGADLSVGGLGSTNAGSIVVGAGRKITITGTATFNGSLTGAGTVSITGGTETVGATATFSPATLTITGGGLTATAGATTDFGTVNNTAGSWTVNNSANVGSGGLTLGSTASAIGYLQGTNGTVAVAGPINLNGGQISTSNLTLTQTGASNGIAFTSPTFGATTRDPSLYGVGITSSGDVTVAGGLGGYSTTVTTTGRLRPAAGASLAGSMTWNVGGLVTVAGASPTIGGAVFLTGNSSTLGADVSLAGLGSSSSGVIVVPAGRILTITAAANFSGSLTGPGTVRITGGTTTIKPGATFSPGTLTMTAGALTVEAGATTALNSANLTGGSWTIGNTAAVGAGGLIVGSSAGAVAYLQGAGSLTVAGPVAFQGGQVSANNLTITQTGSHLFTVATATFGATIREVTLYNANIVTPNDVALQSNSYWYNVGTTARRLAFASGVTQSGGSNFTVGGVTTVTAPATLAGNLTINGATSSLGANLTVNGTTIVAAGGKLSIPTGRILTTTSVRVDVGGLLGGSGTITGSVTNNGAVAPGSSAGTLTVASYTQSESGSLRIELSSASSYDRISVTGGSQPSIAGAIEVDSLGAYVPASGATFAVLSAPTSFADPTLTASVVGDLPGGRTFSAASASKAVTLTAGPSPAKVPGAPKLTVTALPESLKVVVAAAASGGAPITRYRITCVPGCGTTDIGAPGTVVLKGLGGGVKYAVRAVASNSVGDGPAGSASGTPIKSVKPNPSVTVDPSRLVITTAGAFTATCRFNVSPVKTCAVVVTSPTKVVLATGTATVAKGAPSVVVKLKVTAAGVKAAGAAGGVTGSVAATITPLKGAVQKATTTMVIVQKRTTVTLLGGVLFQPNSSTLSTAGKAALTKVAREVAGSTLLRCDGHTADTGNPTGERRLGLERAATVCDFIKAEIARLKLGPVASYVTRSFGATRPVIANPQNDGDRAKNRRVELTVFN